MTNRKYWSGTEITTLKQNEVFVFGSNPQGFHGAGAAKAALAFGAKIGVGRGLSGNSYALVTKNLNDNYTEKSTGITYKISGYRSVSPDQIKNNIIELYEVAKANPSLDFIISFQYELWPNGYPRKSLNGYTTKEMLDLFLSVEPPANIIFNDSYREFIDNPGNHLPQNKKVIKHV